MSKPVKISLYNSLVLSDFFLIKKNNLKRSYFLDLFSLFKSIKQLLRLLQFLQVKSSKTFFIKVDNKYHYFLFKKFLFSYSKLNVKIIINQRLDFKNKNGISFLLFLDNNQLLTDENFYKRLYNNNIFFLNKINSAVEINKGGFYKIYNNIFDYKKIIFLIILLNKIFSNGL
jgi:hypothetical protein